MRVELVYYVEADTASVIILPFIDEYAVGVHRPVVVGSVEYVGCGEFECEGFIKQCLSYGGIHCEPCCAKTVGVHVATSLAVYVHCQIPSFRQSERIVEIIGEDRVVVTGSIYGEPLLVQTERDVGSPSLDGTAPYQICV